MNKVIWGDALQALKTLPDGIVQTCVTSPPYFGLRDYGVEGQIGLEETPEAFTQKLVEVFREVRRVLKDDGTCWVNLGDSYAGSGMGAANYPESASTKQKSNEGSTTAKGRGGNKYGLKPKDLIGIPWRVAFALQADGWYLRQDIIWHKPNPMPESVTDRCTKAHEYIFLLSKSPSYYYDHEAVKEPAATNENRPNGIVRDRIYDYDSKQKQLRVSRALAKGAIARTGGLISGGTTKSTLGISAPTHRNRRSVWTVTTKPYKGAHFATFPPDLIEPCILAGAPKGGVVLDPFAGSGTTLAVAKGFGRQYIGIELNPDYLDLINKRLSNTPSPLPFLEAAE